MKPHPFLLAFFLLVLIGCSQTREVNPSQSIPDELEFQSISTEIRTPPFGTWHLQLSGDVDLLKNASVYEIDMETASYEDISFLHSRGKYVICYFSAGTWEPYRDDSSTFPADSIGDPLPHWPDERWLDISNFEKFAFIMEKRLDLAKEKGCDAVDPDNVDIYLQRSGFPITEEDQLRYNRWLSDAAHMRNLAIGLKNDILQAELLEPFFDFAVNEGCFSFDECGLLAPFAKNGKPIFGVEYGSSLEEFCPKAQALGMSFGLSDLALNGNFTPCP